MKKLSLMIALGIVCSIAIAKPSVNVSTFETYSRQMQMMSEQYISEKKFDYATKALEQWVKSYNSLSEEEKGSFNAVYSDIMYQQARAYTQTNEMYKALKALKESVRTGFNNTDRALNDETLSPLKAYGEFSKILKTIKKS
jgi:hypothetical protein